MDTLKKIFKIKTVEDFNSQKINPLDLNSSHSSVTGILEQSQRYAEELEMKMDKVEDVIELRKEEQLQQNLENPCKYFPFKKFNFYLNFSFSTFEIN